MNLTCSYSEPASITWLKDGAVVSSSFQVDQSSPSSSQLVISSVQHTTHAGQYHCVANTTFAGQVDTSAPFNITVHCEWTRILPLLCIYITFFQPLFFLDLLGNPSISIAGVIASDYHAAVGSTVTFQCIPPEGVPEPTISWIYTSNNPNVNPVPAADVPNVQLQNNTQLVITSVQTSNRGFYDCNATNVIDSRTTELSLTVPSNRKLYCNPTIVCLSNHRQNTLSLLLV